jgi:hypothetical protein
MQQESHFVYTAVFSPGIIFQLVSKHRTKHEVFCLKVRKVTPANGRGRRHGETAGQFHLGVARDIQQAEEFFLFAVIGAGRITRCGPYATVTLRARCVNLLKAKKKVGLGLVKYLVSDLHPTHLEANLQGYHLSGLMIGLSQ